MRRLTLIITIVFCIVFLTACTSEKENVQEARNLPGLTDQLTISGSIANKRDHDFSVQLTNVEGTSDWISLGNEVDNTNGGKVNFATLQIGQEVTITCEDSDCEFGMSISTTN